MKKENNIYEQYIEKSLLLNTESEKFDFLKDFMLNLSPDNLKNFLALQNQAVFSDIHNTLQKSDVTKKEITDLKNFMVDLQNAVKPENAFSPA